MMRALVAAPLAVALGAHTGDNMEQFVVRDDSSLRLAGQPWRFAGMNMYWLGLDENCVPPASGKCVAYPTKFRVRDALETAVALGANVVRSHSLGISTGSPESLEFRKGEFNEAAFEPIDFAISVAKGLGLRLVIPLTDNYDYYHGGYWNFVGFEGGNCKWNPKHIPQPGDDCRAFFDHSAPHGESTIADFKAYIKALLLHVNQFTGTALMDETAILAWETGNELQTKSEPFASWSQEIAHFIRAEIGASQLVLDGRDEVGMGVDGAALDPSKTPLMDMYTDHFYESASSAAVKIGKDSAFAKDAQKVYYVGEYGPSTFSSQELDGFLRALEGNAAVAGDTWWSFFPHGDNYGFVPHGDAYTVHYPGVDEASQSTVLALRAHAYRMRGLEVPEDTAVPQRPVVTQASQQHLAWRGATLAVRYDIEAATGPAGPFTKICDRCVSDHDAPWEVPEEFQHLDHFRLRGYSLGGAAGPLSEVASAAPGNATWPKMAALVDTDTTKVRRVSGAATLV